MIIWNRLKPQVKNSLIARRVMRWSAAEEEAGYEIGERQEVVWRDGHYVKQQSIDFTTDMRICRQAEELTVAEGKGQLYVAAVELLFGRLSLMNLLLLTPDRRCAAMLTVHGVKVVLEKL